ncbi:MAG: hypothetical protein ACRDPE_08545 [Solirubrobacterales bacterium]
MHTQFGAFVLPAVPLLVLVAFLLLGRFPGEKIIERLSRGIAATQRARTGRDSRRRPLVQPVTWAPAGGLLLAFGLARRPPPALL